MISFANEFYQMSLLGPLIRCLYFRDYTIVGSMKILLDDVPLDWLLVLQRDVRLYPLLFPMLWYCISVMLVVGQIFFLCSGHGGVDSLVL